VARGTALSATDRRVARLALPALGTLAIEPLYILVDTAIVGRLGTTQLAGLAVAATVLITLTGLMMFLQYGVTPAVARARGAGQPDEARRAATDAAWVALVIGVVAAVGVAVAARPLVALFGADHDVTASGATYLRISALGLPFVLLTFVGHGVMRGYDRLGRPLVIVAAANVLNVILEIVVVYGFDRGLAGSAWSTVVAQVCAALAFALLVRPLAVAQRPSWKRIRPVLARGLRLSARSLAMLIVLVGSTRVAASVDTPTLAASQVLAQVFSLYALGLDALAIPAQSLVAAALGAADADRAVEVGRSSMKLSLWAGGGLAVVNLALSPLLPHVFSSDGAVTSRTTAGMALVAIALLPAAVAFALDGVLIGADDTRFLARAAAFHVLPWLPVAVSVVAFPAFGIAGIWASTITWMCSRAVLNHRRFTSGRWLLGG
jgi:putative MATE family efflux protein